MAVQGDEEKNYSLQPSRPRYSSRQIDPENLIYRTRVLSIGDGGAVAVKIAEIAHQLDEDVEGVKPEERATKSRYEVVWEGEKDPDDPRCMSKWRKWVIVLIISSVAIARKLVTLHLTEDRLLIWPSIAGLTHRPFTHQLTHS